MTSARVQRPAERGEWRRRGSSAQRRRQAAWLRLRLRKSSGGGKGDGVGLHSGAGRRRKAQRSADRLGLFHLVRRTAIRWTVKLSARKPHHQAHPVMLSADDSIHGHHSLSPLMATSRDQPNPLRPYYIPPSIGLPSDPVPNAAPRASPSAKPSASPPKPSFGSQARDILSDLDYGVDLSLGDGSPTVAEMAKKLLDQAVWNYTSVLFAQPFEVAKTVLQLHSPAQSDEQRNQLDSEDARRRAAAAARARYDEVCLFACDLFPCLDPLLIANNSISPTPTPPTTLPRTFPPLLPVLTFQQHHVPRGAVLPLALPRRDHHPSRIHTSST